ncbi:uncharacterized protein LOC118261770 [Spodoptera frugiperda]|uniref:Uncharacterized protein LOC118261770 n=1 Tax=Spodoptera frugiperda TaxID=7108 RepID=A0A9R0E1Q4_SPOFR|nr:uncharacterized protein LOC118261770 [Spodoptera frugiperda]
MYCLKFLVSVVVLVLISQEENEVSAAPCKWMWDHITHTPPTTPPTPTAPTTPMTPTTPDLIEDFARLKKKKVKQWDQLVNDWLFWGPQNENPSSKPRNPVKRIISSYMKLLAKLYSMFST